MLDDLRHKLTQHKTIDPSSYQLREQAQSTSIRTARLAVSSGYKHLRVDPPSRRPTTRNEVDDADSIGNSARFAGRFAGPGALATTVGLGASYNLVFQHIMEDTANRFSPEEHQPSQENSLYEQRLRRLFSKEVNLPSLRSVSCATALHTVVKNISVKVDDLISTANLRKSEEIQKDLRVLEEEASGARTMMRKQLKEVAQYATSSDTLTGVLADLVSIEGRMQSLRRDHPDQSPVRLDNSKAFINPVAHYQESTLVAYVIALITRIFDGTSQRCASVILKTVKSFGSAIAEQQTGGPELSQRRAIADIPDSIETLENRFNLHIPSIPYAICRKCSFLQAPIASVLSPLPVYPDSCEECQSNLKEEGKSPKIFHYYPFFEWFGRLLSLPDVERYGDDFCARIDGFVDDPIDKSHPSDGSYIREILDVDGKPFIASRGREGRWLFKLHADFFNVERNTIRGPNKTTGVMALTCLNLPHKMANDPAYMYVVGLIEGPHEPDSKVAGHSPYLRPLVDDLLAGYRRGITFHSTYRSPEDLTSTPSILYQRVHRPILANAVMDFKAARPFAGLMDVNANNYCFVCSCWHQAHLWRTDFENWSSLDDEKLREGAEMWKNSSDDQKGLENISMRYGTRWSELWRLPYWRPTRQLVVDPMHTIFLVLEQRFFRVALGLDNPFSKKKQQKKKDKIEEEHQRLTFIAHYHEFTPPPHPSIVLPRGKKPAPSIEEEVADLLALAEEGDEDVLSHLHWAKDCPERSRRSERHSQWREEIIGDSRAFQGVSYIHDLLSAPRPSQGAETTRLTNWLKSQKWVALAYVCNDLMVFPNPPFAVVEGVSVDLRLQSKLNKRHMQKEQMAEALVKWRKSEIQDVGQFKWPYFTSIAPDAPSMDPMIIPGQDNSDGSTGCREFDEDTRKRLLTVLGENMNYPSAVGVGIIHRKLLEPFSDTERGNNELDKSLRGRTQASLTFVCVDLNRLPQGKFKKGDLILQLIAWRKSKPLEALQKSQIDSEEILKHVWRVIHETSTPTWVSKPPDTIGLDVTGSLKADEWRTTFAIHLPFALLDMLEKDPPDGKECSVLDTSMALTCAASNATKNTLSSHRREQFRKSLRCHILGLNEHFPGFILPSHHLAFHIYDFMGNFSAIRFWWAFPLEQLIGKLQRMPINHHIGHQEKTILDTFYKISFFRQWLIRPDCPPRLAECRQDLDKAYGYDIREQASNYESSLGMNRKDPSTQLLDHAYDITYFPPGSRVPDKLRQILGDVSNIRCISRVSGPSFKGHYSARSSLGIGNSYICYMGEESSGQEWFAGQIQFIFRREDDVYMVVRQSKPSAERNDPFRAYWSDGFEAKTVSQQYESTLQIINIRKIISHTARWEFNRRSAVVLNLSRE